MLATADSASTALSPQPSLPARTLSDCCALYCTHAMKRERMAKSTAEKYRHCLNRWFRMKCPANLNEIMPKTFEMFRDHAKSAGLSNFTIEDDVACVLTLLRKAKRKGWTDENFTVPEPDPEDKLPRVMKQSKLPPFSHFGLLYANAEAAVWPKRGFRSVELRTHFWHTWLVAEATTALRLMDIAETLSWRHFSDGVIEIEANKTGKVQHIPLHKALQYHLVHPLMRRIPDDPRVFCAAPDPDKIRKQLYRMADAAGIEPISPQQMRAMVATAFEKVHATAGPLILGHTVPGERGSETSFKHYIRELEILSEASPKLPLPQQMLQFCPVDADFAI